ncbi:MAG: hypothetical protein HFI08_01475 [Bacilli bacterium]|nr:hypothetical protein [Bacilli bacterium]
MNCKYLKIKMNHSFECKKSNKIIDIRKCNKTNCEYFEYKEKSNSYQIKKKSSKLAKLERNRYSVFTDNKDKCMLCGSTKNLTWHECFSGRNRQRSMKYRFIIPLCEYHHSTLQEDADFNQYWHDRCRDYFLEHYGDLDEFIKTFGKSYLK